ncbi:uncharacterized protein L969DRAFT_85059 [Mixia osmundae IAM 14324]|uniref:uncharacterized protein n=1 Tax=Mixia osmundae (strain CBS 9802 / IAM 14324 / JCM 22182 / KY 12970) TaxID=764103 RepID=UPI0004A557C2|nr:uncharacterized protein L969DRAFT_85059 [Mixia osmundae IAM 14324]KEI41285.1 hypothetical protein L969DRAFT_85059 [Mixia osmundae IAM 14324]
MSSYGIHDRAVDNLCYLTSLDASLWDVTWRPIKDLAPYITQELADKVRDESSVPEAAPLDKVLSCYWTVKRRFQELEDWLDAYDEHLAKCRLTKEYFYQQWRATREEDITSFLDLCRVNIRPCASQRRARFLLHYATSTVSDASQPLASLQRQGLSTSTGR